MLIRHLNLFKVIPLDLGQAEARVIDLQTKQLFKQSTCTPDVLDQIDTLAPQSECWFDQGTVVAPERLRRLLDDLLEPVWHPRLLLQPTLVTTAGNFTTQAEKQILAQTLYRVGARKVIIFPTVLASALGSGVSFRDASASILLHLGQSSVEMGLIHLGQVMATQTSFFAGSWLDQMVIQQVKTNHQLVLTPESLFRLKRDLLSFQTKRHLSVKGKDIETGGTTTKVVSSTEFSALLKRLADKYVYLVTSVLKRAPIGLTTQAVEKGILLTGGLAQLDGLDRYLAHKLGFPVLSTQTSELTIIWGLSQLATQLEQFSDLAFSLEPAF